MRKAGKNPGVQRDRRVVEDEAEYSTAIPSRIARPHEHLQCWREAIDLVTVVYQDTRSFPASEQYGLTSQMRRAAVSVPSNIAEGVARRGIGERQQLLTVARGSLSELETQILISQNLGFLSKAKADSILQRTGRIGAMLNGLLRR